ncbi:MAG: DUF3667 domain-containing protein [Bacteroidaceae bacterium]|nr:DUF3667 domain-containing protein [Bacteroidaceae bacterium]
MNLKNLRSRFRAWQHEPLHFENTCSEKHVCANCGNEFTGNFCPVCGQKSTYGRISWKSIGLDLMKVWGRESRSAVSSVMQLLGRPGYLINDYIHGRRQVCYSPVSMLFLIAIVVIILHQLTGNTPSVEITTDNENDFQIIKGIIVWFQNHPAWGVLALTSFIILPTWLLFRNSPRNTHHTLPDGIYIQIFLSSVLLLISLFSLISGAFLLLIPVYYHITYRQLFGYGFWGTLWRILLLLTASAVAGLILITLGCILIGDYSFNQPLPMTLLIFLALLAVPFVALFIGYLIGVFTARKRVQSE